MHAFRLEAPFLLTQAAFDEFHLPLIDFAFVYGFGYKFYFCPARLCKADKLLHVLHANTAVSAVADKSSKGGF